MKKRDNIIYYVSTVLFSLMLFAGAIAYFVQYEMAHEMFTSLGVPTAIIYPLAIAKILGVIALLFIKNDTLKKLAYAGFTIDLVMAIGAHLNAGHGDAFGPAIPLVLLAISFWFYRRGLAAA